MGEQVNNYTRREGCFVDTAIFLGYVLGIGLVVDGAFRGIVVSPDVVQSTADDGRFWVGAAIVALSRIADLAKGRVHKPNA